MIHPGGRRMRGRPVKHFSFSGRQEKPNEKMGGWRMKGHDRTGGIHGGAILPL